MRKDAADNALSLDGTSFMSRILKVVIAALGSYIAVDPCLYFNLLQAFFLFLAFIIKVYILGLIKAIFGFHLHLKL